MLAALHQSRVGPANNDYVYPLLARFSVADRRNPRDLPGSWATSHCGRRSAAVTLVELYQVVASLNENSLNETTESYTVDSNDVAAKNPNSELATQSTGERQLGSSVVKASSAAPGAKALFRVRLLGAARNDISNSARKLLLSRRSSASSKRFRLDESVANQAGTIIL